MGSITKRGKKYFARIRLTKNYISHNEAQSFESELEASVIPPKNNTDYK